MQTSCLKYLPRGCHFPLACPTWRSWFLWCGLSVALVAGLPGRGQASDTAHTEEASAKKSASTASATKAATDNAPGSIAKSVADQIRAAVDGGALNRKQQTLTIDNDSKKTVKAENKPRHAEVEATKKHGPSQPSHDGDVHWSYEGENGPQAWGKLKSEFSVCATGKRQSPINIEESSTLQGPAEPLQFSYQTSGASVVNNGHTIQVDLVGENSLTVRNSTYKLLQFHFHTPSEERINHQSFAMVAHLVHKNAEGQLAVVAVLLDPGVANALINKVWTHMPLDSNDRVRLPGGIIDMNELLPKDQRYYQFMGSLTTPPCTEGVLWLVLKQAATLSAAQIKMFSQLFPNNARPLQPLNGRVVRDAQ